ncbi:MAG: ribosomal L7Ae/L30e/S12e/Gadd45 family protein [Clostridia bacterium]|nr:ribosomal L7Ae/L30e/S12e/Gadd45 family protein [Clostridia bacterium]
MNKALGMLGLAKRAGKVLTGEFLCDKAIKSGQSHLIIIASDISENSKKAVCDACNYYGVEYIEFGTAEELGRFTGSDRRVVVSVNDEKFKDAILSKIERIDD